MKALESIHLGDNWQLTGSIPASFWTLSNLTAVVFTATNLIGYDATPFDTSCITNNRQDTPRGVASVAATETVQHHIPGRHQRIDSD